MFTIRIRFEEEGRPPVLLKRVRGGQSLLELCLKQGITLNHVCGGICACSTCHLYVDAGNEHLEPKSRREMHFIERLPGVREGSRLACQCILLGKKGMLELTLPIQLP